MTKTDEYRRELSRLEDWDEFLMANSGLPGPRGNIELAKAAADLQTPEGIRRWLTWDEDRAPVNSPHEFLAFCGALGLGRLVVEGDEGALAELRRCASDGRWRTREAVAMALQRIGDDDFDRLVDEMGSWAHGSYLEQRAAAAGLCEPRLLATRERADRVLEILDVITSLMSEAPDRRSEQFKALRKGMGYCWSVAVVAGPDAGTDRMEKWLESDDPDVRWVMRENLRKKRLERMDADWVTRQKETLANRG
jgi:hypothetical protein